MKQCCWRIRDILLFCVMIQGTACLKVITEKKNVIIYHPFTKEFAQTQKTYSLSTPGGLFRVTAERLTLESLTSLAYWVKPITCPGSYPQGDQSLLQCCHLLTRGTVVLLNRWEDWIIYTWVINTVYSIYELPHRLSQSEFVMILNFFLRLTVFLNLCFF